MGAVIGFVLIILFIGKCISETSKLTMPGGYDTDKLRQGSVDVSTGKLSQKDYQKRISSGYYHKQK